MRTAADIAQAIHTGKRLRVNNSILIYGGAKTGKTRLAASVAELPGIDRVLWFDLERGSDTIFSGEAGISQTALAKIIPIFFQDTTEYPVAATTMLKLLSSTRPLHVDVESGDIKPGKGDQTVSIHYQALPQTTAVVIDTISQLADSIWALLQIEFSYRDPRKFWGEFHPRMNAIFSCVQASSVIQILLAHELLKEGTQKAEGDTRKVQKAVGDIKTSAILVQDDRMIPMCGSQPYSLKVGKYMSTVVRLYLERKAWKSLSSPVTIANVRGGSRLGVDVSKIASPTIADILKLPTSS